MRFSPSACQFYNSFSFFVFLQDVNRIAIEKGLFANATKVLKKLGTNAWKVSHWKQFCNKIFLVGWNIYHELCEYLFSDCPTNGYRKGKTCECNNGFEKVGSECWKSESFEEYFEQITILKPLKRRPRNRPRFLKIFESRDDIITGKALQCTDIEANIMQACKFLTKICFLITTSHYLSGYVWFHTLKSITNSLELF